MALHTLKRLAGVAVVALAFTAVAAHADALANIKKAKKIRIATDLSTAPDGMTDPSMKPTGRDVEIAVPRADIDGFADTLAHDLQRDANDGGNAGCQAGLRAVLEGPVGR